MRFTIYVLISLALVALFVTLFIFYRNPYLLIPIPFLLFISVKGVRFPKIRDQKSLNDFIRKYYGIKGANNILYDAQGAIYAYFPSMLKSGIAVVTDKYFILKKEQNVEVYCKYEGLDLYLTSMKDDEKINSKTTSKAGGRKSG
ncbi:MAG: hypothetical protein OWQ54_05275 [Sulfolobaceae archaeon]|nr:hypothetical protein [Sulfolobaceae archaeon]